MRFHVLIGALLVAVCACAPIAKAQGLRLVSVYNWPKEAHFLGGFSGIEISDAGANLRAISDRGHLITAKVTRTKGQIEKVALQSSTALMDQHGKPLTNGFGDAEGLAIGPGGATYISFEGAHRVTAYDAGRVSALKGNPAFTDLPYNGGIEALAIDRQGRILAIPERSGKINNPFPVWRLDETWKIAFHIPRSGGFSPVGADIGPDNMLYLLERGFSGFGFVSRLRRFDAQTGENEEQLWQSKIWQYDNLEGLSVWRDVADKIRVTMISDDNFNFLQNTQIVEFVLE